MCSVQCITDATEDAQLEAALKASVKETKIKETVVVSSDEEFDSDVELETFTDSEDDTDKPSLAKRKSESGCSKKKPVVKGDTKVSVVINIDEDHNENIEVLGSKSKHVTESSGSALNDTEIPPPDDENTNQDTPSVSSHTKSIPSTSTNSGSSDAVKSEVKETHRSVKNELADSGLEDVTSSASSNSSKDGESSRQSKFQFVAQSTPSEASWRDYLGNKDGRCYRTTSHFDMN